MQLRYPANSAGTAWTWGAGSLGGALVRSGAGLISNMHGWLPVAVSALVGVRRKPRPNIESVQSRMYAETDLGVRAGRSRWNVFRTDSIQLELGPSWRLLESVEWEVRCVHTGLPGFIRVVGGRARCGKKREMGTQCEVISCSV